MMSNRSSKYNIGAVVGRFQLDVPHPAHMYLIQHALDKHQNVVILLGVAKVINSRKNPLDFISRKLMIEEYFSKDIDRIVIMQLPNQAEDPVWSKEIDKRLAEIHPNKSIVLYGGRDSFFKSYTGKHDKEEVEQDLFVSATDVRLAASQKILKSVEYRIGQINAAYSRYPACVSAVDVVVFNEDESKTLLAKKEGESGWRFIGGHEDPSDDTGEAAAKRELTEETGRGAEFVITDYLGRVKIDDWRYAGEEDAIKTTFYKAKLIFGPVVPADDIDQLKWVTIEEFKKIDIVPEHERLRALVIEKCLTKKKES